MARHVERNYSSGSGQSTLLRNEMWELHAPVCVPHLHHQHASSSHWTDFPRTLARTQWRCAAALINCPHSDPSTARMGEKTQTSRIDSAYQTRIDINLLRIRLYRCRLNHSPGMITHRTKRFFPSDH